MKTFLKILLSLGILLLLLVATVLYTLNSQSLLDTVAKKAITQTGMDIKYSSLEGNLFDGLKVKGFNYEEKVKADLKFKADFKAMQTGIVHIEDINISNLWINEDFLNSLTGDSNETKEEKASSDSFIKKLIVDRASVHLVDFHYQEYVVDVLNLQIEDLSYDMEKDITAKIKSDFKSNVADAILSAKIKDEKYSFSLEADPKKAFITSYVKDHNVSIENAPHILLKGEGDFHKLKANLSVEEAKLTFQNIQIAPQDLNLDAFFDIDKNDLNAKFVSFIESSATDLNLDLDANLNIKDINNTLDFNLISDLTPKNEYLQNMLKEQKLTIEKLPKLAIKAAGDFNLINAHVKVDEGSLSYNEINIAPKGIDLNTTYSLKKGDLNAIIFSDIRSDLANFDLDGVVALNSNDINNTLKVDLQSHLIPIQKLLKTKFSDQNITIKKMPEFLLDVKGDYKNLALTAHLGAGDIRYNAYELKPKVVDINATFSPQNGDLNADVITDIDSNIANAALKAIVSLNHKDLNNTLKYDANLILKDAQPFEGIDLSSLGTINANLKGSLKDLDANVKSPKLNLVAKSSDFDRFNVNLDTEKIYIGKIYRYLPKELQKSFVHLKSNGFYKLSQKEAKFTTTLRGLKYADKIISTKEFDFYMKDEDIKLSNFSLLADGFDLGLDLSKSGEKIVAKIENKAIQGDADITLKPLFVDAKVHIDSIDKLIKEINKVYPLEVGMEVDGALDLVANMEGEDAKMALTSKKISFKDGDVVDLNLLGLYNPKRVLIKNFDFELKGFDPKEFNRKVRLKRDGLITLDQETNRVDFALENLLEFKGTQKGDVATGKLTTDKLMLAYDGYGSTNLTTNLDMYQSKEQLAVTGFIEFRDTEINYESPFLDVSKDPDIVIITRESKGKKPPSDNFLLNTFLDLDIRSKNEMLYNVDAGEIEFSPDIKVRKDFGSLPKITGKIKVLDGQYDVADKRFQIQEGAIAFRGQEGSNPLLDLNVNWEEIDDVVIMIAIGGDKNRPKLVFSSKPMMSKKDIFSYLLFGMSASETEGAATSANKAAEKIFGRAVAKDLARELNLDRLDMNRNELGGIDVKAGKKVNRKSILYYQNKLNESSVLYERKLSKKWSVETEVGKQGQGVDIFYRKGYQ